MHCMIPDATWDRGLGGKHERWQRALLTASPGTAGGRPPGCPPESETGTGRCWSRNQSGGGPEQCCPPPSHASGALHDSRPHHSWRPPTVARPGNAGTPHDCSRTRFRHRRTTGRRLVSTRLLSRFQAHRAGRLQVGVTGGMRHDVAPAAAGSDEASPGRRALCPGRSPVQALVEKAQRAKASLVHVLLLERDSRWGEQTFDRDWPLWKPLHSRVLKLMTPRFPRLCPCPHLHPAPPLTYICPLRTKRTSLLPYATPFTAIWRSCISFEVSVPVLSLKMYSTCRRIAPSSAAWLGLWLWGAPH